MTDYSDILLLIGAIAIYAILVTNTNRTMLMNEQVLTTAEVEYGAISAAQDIMGEVRWMNYEAFKNTNKEETANKLEAVNDDDLYTETVEIEPIIVNGVSADSKLINVKVESDYMVKGEDSVYNVTLSYIKTDY